MADWKHAPDRAQLRAVLERFFVAPIDEAVVDRLAAALSAVLADPVKRASQGESFMSSHRRYEGEEWRELVPIFNHGPSPTQLAVWLAIGVDGYPPRRPHCPEPIVGAWTQVEPRSARWQLGADGAFRCDDPKLSQFTAWRLHHFASNVGFRGDTLIVADGSFKSGLVISEVAEERLVLIKTGGAFPDVTHVLARSS
jgi:hypothetical protein